MTPIEQLMQLYTNHNRAAYPSVPPYAVPKPQYSDKTTNGLTKMVMDYIQFSGGMVKRVNVMGRKIRAKSGKEIWIPSATIKGAADLSAIYKGMPLEIEIKCTATRDRIRPKQIEYARRVTMSGGYYFAARTFEEFYDWFENLTR